MRYRWLAKSFAWNDSVHTVYYWIMNSYNSDDISFDITRD